MSNTLLDWRGTPIVVGSTVVYPVRQSSSMWVCEGRVEEITKTNTLWRREPEYKVKVLHLKSNWPLHTGRNVYVYPNVSRITVLS